MTELSQNEIEELGVLREAVDAIGRPSFQIRTNYNSEYRRLHRRGLITWKPGQAEGFSNKFAAVDITPAGRATIDRAISLADKGVMP